MKRTDQINGLHGCLLNHTVRENTDGLITVAPGDGSSNSILVRGRDAWHGYITEGLWRRFTRPGHRHWISRWWLVVRIGVGSMGRKGNCDG